MCLLYAFPENKGIMLLLFSERHVEKPLRYMRHNIYFKTKTKNKKKQSSTVFRYCKDCL